MLRCLFMLMLMLSVLSLGLPSFAHAGDMSQEATTEAMPHDCVCPPGHEMPAPDDSNKCMQTLGCLMQCGTAQLATSLDVFNPLDPAKPKALATEISEAVPSSSYPPFRPPSL